MNPRKRNEIRGDAKEVLFGKLAGWLMRLWAMSLRVEVEDQAGMVGRESPQRPVIFLLWHNRVFSLPPVWWRMVGRFRRGPVVLTSASKDGAVVAAALGVFGMGAIRGSSSRRGAAALIALKRALMEGLDVCVTPDGPKGPRYRFQPGVIKLAQVTGSSIVPVHLVCRSAWRLRTWDRLVIPRPFSRVRMILGSELVVTDDLDDAGFEAERSRIEKAMLALTEDI